MATFRAFLDLYNENDEKNTYLPFTDMDAVYSQDGYDNLVGSSHTLNRTSTPLTLRDNLKTINKAVYDLKEGAFLNLYNSTSPAPVTSSLATPNLVYNVQESLNSSITKLQNRVRALESGSSSATSTNDIYDKIVPLLNMNSVIKAGINTKVIAGTGDTTISASDRYDEILGVSSGSGTEFTDLYSDFLGKVLYIEVKLNNTECIIYYALNLSNRSRFSTQKLVFLFASESGNGTIFDEGYIINKYQMSNSFSSSLISGGKYKIAISFNEGRTLNQADSFLVNIYSACIFDHK